MALDKVVNEIQESARKEADLRIQEAEKERAKILQEADQRIEKMHKAEEKDLQDTLRRMQRQELSSAELEARRIVLNKRKEVLDKTFEETLHELSNMDPKEKAAVYKKILSNGKKLVPRPKVFVPRNESSLISGVRGVESVEETDMESGIVMESQDGTVRLDYRFRTILESNWEKELKNVSGILFG